MNEVMTIDKYFAEYGEHHSRKATELLSALHRPGIDPVPDFSKMLRQPFSGQSAAIAAAVAMLNETRRGIIAAEMGTGKTIMGMLSIHAHATQSARKGGRNGRYRAIVLCPDHLIKKWRDEIEETIPGANVTVFDAGAKGQRVLIGEMVQLYDRLKGRPGRWRKPTGPEWYVLGRNQAKYLPVREPVAMGRKQIIDIDDKAGRYRKVVRRDVCPMCGFEATDKKGEATDIIGSEILTRCEARWAKEIGDSAKRDCGLDRGRIIGPTNNPAYAEGRILEHEGKQWRMCVCGSPYWQFTNQLKRWPPGYFFPKKLHRAFHYLIVDEIHEHKSPTAGQAAASARLIADVPHTLALTGTLIGGYADHLYPLLWRFSPDQLVEQGYEWGKPLDFIREYGRIERIERSSSNAKLDTVVTTSTRSMRKTDASRSVSERPAPGIMPALFGRQLIDKTIFMSLEDLATGLPPYREYIGGSSTADYTEEDHKYHVDACSVMEPDQAAAYKDVEDTLVSRCRAMMQKGQMKLLGAMLITLLEYPDHPWDWKAPTGDPGHLAVGYWETPGSRTASNWRGVVQPASLDQSTVYPKEQTLIDLCSREIRGGNQVWIYTTMTNKRDVQDRWKRLLTEAGLRVAILRASAVAPRKRLEWIEKNGPKVDCVISHPGLVKTGVDFFGRNPGSHNFNSIVFAQTGYDVFTLRQAARRAWRIGQSKSCRVSYLYYAGTMQQRAMELVSRKMAAALALDGELNAEGLCAMADDGGEEMALARSISDSIKDGDLQRNWQKVRANLPSDVHPIADAQWIKIGLESLDETPLDGIDLLPFDHALLAQTLLDLDAETDSPQLSRELLAKMADEMFGDIDLPNLHLVG